VADVHASQPSGSLAGQETFPAGLRNAYLFATFNGLSFQIVLNSPMILYAKALGASATELGIIAGMMPLLVIFQIPAAQYISRVGYRRFVYAGWGTRVSFIFAMALVPLTEPFLLARTRLSLILMLLFGFNLSRGISSAAWLPWIASLVPEAVRGRYLARDAACVNVASFASFILAAGCLGTEPRAWQFAALFAFSALMGATSLVFLKRIPDVPAPPEPRASTMAVPWLAMAQHPPFRRLLELVIAWSVVYGGMTAFTVAFLKSETGLSEGAILLISSVSFLGGLSSLWFLGSRLDSLGSKPVLTFSFMVWLLILAGWAVLAGRAFPVGVAAILGLQLLMGLGAALVGMAHTRLAMAVIPPLGRNHFFALYSVVGCLALGVAPIAWGLIIDAVGTWKARGLGLEWNHYTIFFAAVAVLLGLTLLLARRLEEPKAASMDVLLKEVLQYPQRVWMRLWPRA
jgi:MFS family permease